ncbi:MAG TPA: 2-oxo acid dehydrogenase subunit E2 [Steroidobacteraceae bacterium]|nr:2-oxo acid dehydrogenase subunit E2 [Steroidobacteraceae bacterium]
MASTVVVVPDLGGFKDVAIIDVLVKVGDRVEADTPLLTLETEKATMDVPSPGAGVIEKLLVKKGGVVSAGTPVALLKAEGAAVEASPPPIAAPSAVAVPAVAAPPVKESATAAPAPASAPASPTPVVAAAPVNEAGFAAAHASPGVRRFARELGVDLSRVRGTGLKNRILEDDVKAYVKGLLSGGAGAAGAAATSVATAGTGLPRIAIPDFAQFGAIEVKPLGRVKRISGPRLHAAWVNLPHVTQFDEADITELEAARAKLKDRAAAQGVKLTPLAFVLRAVVRTLAQFPHFNASLDAGGENLVYKKYVHLGFAADTPNGLLVPVIRDADKKDIYELARALATLSEKARAGKLSGAEMQGGCFTVSSLGGIGGTAFTPIINAPELAILGVSRSQMKPVWRDGAFVPRLMMPLSLSYDHRVIDGADGARFSTALAAQLNDVAGLLEAVP